MLKKTVLISILTITSSLSFAGNFPRGCVASGFSFKNNFLVLNQDGKQTFYLLQNRTNKPLQLERYETRDVFMSPKLESHIAPSYWAAFSSDEANMHIQCFMKDKNNTTRVNRNEVLEICQYPHAKFALSNMGNYWVSTNKPQNLVIKEAVAKGIYLKW